MSVLQIFVTDQELGQILHEFALRRGLMGALNINNLFELHDPEQGLFDFLQQVDVTKFYLFPRTQVLPNPPSDDIIAPRYLGWVDVWVGHLVVSPDRTVLTITTIQAENRQELDFKPANWLRELKKHLHKTLIFGVDGINPVYENASSSLDKDIGYSLVALRLYKSGVQWKQFDTGNVEFSPAMDAE